MDITTKPHLGIIRYNWERYRDEVVLSRSTQRPIDALELISIEQGFYEGAAVMATLLADAADNKLKLDRQRLNDLFDELREQRRELLLSLTEAIARMAPLAD